jgi:hypothetical protein
MEVLFHNRIQRAFHQAEIAVIYCHYDGNSGHDCIQDLSCRLILGTAKGIALALASGRLFFSQGRQSVFGKFEGAKQYAAVKQVAGNRIPEEGQAGNIAGIKSRYSLWI